MKIKLKIAMLIMIFTCCNGLLYYFSTIEDVTFSQLKQNSVATIKKYKNYWNNETIKTQILTKQWYEDGDIIATLTIPNLDIYELAIYYGVDDENKNWQITTPTSNGNWQMFGEYGSSLVGAHNNQLFKNLPNLKVGDKFIIETPVDVYVYEVKQKTIYRHDKGNSWEDIVYNGKEPYSTNLVTCYPVGEMLTKDRYIIYATLQRGTIFIE